MPVPTFSGYRRLTRSHKLSAAGAAAAVGASALAFAVVPGGSAEAEQGTQAKALSAKPVAELHTQKVGKIQKDSLTQQSAEAAKKAKAQAAAKKAALDAAAKKAAEQAAAKKAAEQAAAKKQAAAAMAKKKADYAKKMQAEAKAKAAKAKAAAPKPKQYPNNLDGWIRESLDIMHKKGIPGSYDGIKRNIMRESAGDPNAVNGYDINAQNGTPSKGLLQVIQPTFEQYHVDGTSWNLTDPVANITAACNYAADRYGSMDNVNSAY